MSSRGTFAGVAPSGRFVMLGATTGLEMFHQALANWPILVSTWVGGPRPTLTQNFASCTGTLPRTTPNTIEAVAGGSPYSTRCGSHVR